MQHCIKISPLDFRLREFQTIDVAGPRPWDVSHVSTARRFLLDQSGATAIEYCLIAGSIALVIVAGVKGIGTKLLVYFTSINNGIG